LAASVDSSPAEIWRLDQAWETARQQNIPNKGLVSGAQLLRVDFDFGKLSSHLIGTGTKGESHVVGVSKGIQKSSSGWDKFVTSDFELHFMTCPRSKSQDQAA
jgi:hypothetical protein